MKATVLFLLMSACGACAAQSGGVYFNADTLATDCRVAIRTRDNPAQSPAPQAIQDVKDSQLCIGYMTGVVDSYEVEPDSLKTAGRGLCVPDDVRSTQLVRVFVKYADDHPEELHLAAPTVVWNSLHKAFPCAR
jgi:hypothetical protein